MKTLLLALPFVVGCDSAYRIEPDADGDSAVAEPDAPTRDTEMAVSNSDVFGGFEATGIVTGPVNGTFDTDACAPVGVLGKCNVATRPDDGEACVCKLDKLTIGTLEIRGTRALVLIANDSVRVLTGLDVSGTPGTPGPGASREYPNDQRRAGGSFATLGGAGSQPAAPIYGDASLIPLYGGMSGARGTNFAGSVGGGGGALQISARNSIVVGGVIDASGGGGGGGSTATDDLHAKGGGSGGAILLEAPSVLVDGELLALGGGGGGGGYSGGTPGKAGGNGANGGLGAYADGTGCNVSTGDGGDGAQEGKAAEAGQPFSICSGSTYLGAGGGGGGLGRIRINTSTFDGVGTIAPKASFAPLLMK